MQCMDTMTVSMWLGRNNPRCGAWETLRESIFLGLGEHLVSPRIIHLHSVTTKNILGPDSDDQL